MIYLIFLSCSRALWPSVLKWWLLKAWKYLGKRLKFHGDYFNSQVLFCMSQYPWMFAPCICPHWSPSCNLKRHGTPVPVMWMQTSEINHCIIFPFYIRNIYLISSSYCMHFLQKHALYDHAACNADNTVSCRYFSQKWLCNLRDTAELDTNWLLCIILMGWQKIFLPIASPSLYYSMNVAYPVSTTFFIILSLRQLTS